MEEDVEGLNPFEFRAFNIAHKMCPTGNYSAVLIPLNSGHSILRFPSCGHATYQGLNPFEFRAFNIAKAAAKLIKAKSLNPFEFRAFNIAKIDALGKRLASLNPFEFRAFNIANLATPATVTNGS